MAVWNVILAHHALDTSANGRAGKRPSFVNQFGFGGNQFAVLGRTKFYTNLCAGSGASALEYFGSRQLDFDRSAGLLRKQGCDGLNVGDALGPESSANLHRNRFYLAHRDS